MARIDETRPFLPVNIAVLTVSDTRTAANDTSGDTLAARIAAAGHVVADRAHRARRRRGHRGAAARAGSPTPRSTSSSPPAAPASPAAT